MEKKYLLLIPLILITALIPVLSQVSANSKSEQLQVFHRDLELNISVKLDDSQFTSFLNSQSDEKKPVEKNLDDAFKVKGIFVTGWMAGIEKKIDDFIELTKQTDINAFVIDVKDDTGTVSYLDSTVPLAKEIKATRRKIKDIRALIKKLKAENIYLIARVVVFKDPLLAKTKKERALPLKDETTTWIDDEWVNPYLLENWDYVIALAKEALDLGFDEIQFDYIRFPALGYGATQVAHESELSKEAIINTFLSYAKEELSVYNAPISADIFGAVTSIKDDLGIGQKLESICSVVDIVSPMVYPSHYAHGVFDLEVPETAPYETIYYSMDDAIKRLTPDHPVRLRPWLQDFSLKHAYGVEEVKEQITALNDLGIEEWLLWNPRSRYTIAALLPEVTGTEQKIIETEQASQRSVYMDVDIRGGIIKNNERPVYGLEIDREVPQW